MNHPFPRLVVLALLLAGLAGCYRTGIGLDPRGDDDDAADDDDSIGNFEITGLEPAQGSAEGGYEVEILLDTDISAADPDDIIVHFGDELAEVLFRDADSVHVIAPPACVPESLAVEVEIVGAGADSADFQYAAWAYGQDVAVVSLARTEIQSQGSGVQGAALAEFFEPTAAPPLANLPTLGSCIQSPTINPAPRVNHSIGNGVTMSAGGSPFTLGFDPSDSSYSASGLTAAHLPAPASYSLSGGVDPDGCPVELPGVVDAPNPLYVVDPPMDLAACDNGQFWCYFLDPDPTGQNAAGVTVQWTAGTGNIVLQIDRIDYYGDGLSGSLLCHLQDNGYVMLTNTELTSMAEGLYQFGVLRYRTTPQAHPRSGGTVYGTFLEQQIGYGWIFQTINGCYNNACG
ncbi:MAG: IPT/TIG domain-containing protein [Myxococcota bacterium]|nr:IPT/TIG domain-containing protein [Myxococcota bacterium]